MGYSSFKYAIRSGRGGGSGLSAWELLWPFILLIGGAGVVGAIVLHFIK